MDKQFFQLRRHWTVAIAASAIMATACALHSSQMPLLSALFQLSVLVLFIQFVWSGAFGIAALLSGHRAYFFALTLLCVFELTALCAGIFFYLN